MVKTYTIAKMQHHDNGNVSYREVIPGLRITLEKAESLVADMHAGGFTEVVAFNVNAE